MYNECESLEHFVNEMDGFLKEAKWPSKVLFVNDGSTDSSQQIMEDICSKNKAYAYLELEQNVGLSGAMKAGIDAADTEYLGYIDADVQTHPMDFCLFFSQ